MRVFAACLLGMIAVAMNTACADAPRKDSTSLIRGCRATMVAIDEQKGIPSTFEAGYCVGLVAGVLQTSFHASGQLLGEKVCIPGDYNKLLVMQKLVELSYTSPSIKAAEPFAIVILAIRHTYPCTSGG